VRKIRAGCIQGSIIGPLLFNIYTSHLTQVVSPCQCVSYADDTYVVVEGSSKEEMLQVLEKTLKQHFEWLGSIGMICNLTKTELISFCGEEIECSVNGVSMKSKETIKVLGVLMDNKLSWSQHVEKLIASSKKLTFALRYIRQNVDASVMNDVIRAQVVSKLSYASPAWSHRIGYNLRARLRSAFFKILRNVVRDFDFKYNRRILLQLTGQESIDNTWYKRSSVLLFKLVTTITPTELACTVLSKSYFNERSPGHLSFFSTNKSKFGKACLTNAAKEIVEKWDFDWLNLTVATFKSRLSFELDNMMML